MRAAIIAATGLALAACSPPSKEDLVTARQWGGYCSVRGNSYDGCVLACMQEFDSAWNHEEFEACAAGVREYFIKGGRL